MKIDSFKNIKLLSSEDIQKLVSIGEAIDAQEQAFASFSEGTSQVPQRFITAVQNLDLFLKPAFSEQLGRLAVKMITQKKDGTIPGIPAILGVVLLMDMESGAILSMMDGSYITALRTGAASGIATKLLAKQTAETVAIFGCGVQGKTQLEAVCSVRPIKHALLFDLNEEAAMTLKAFAEEHLNIAASVGKTVTNLKEADILCTATNAEKPLFLKDDISEGVHINAIGSYTPAMQEIDPAIIQNSKLYVDSRESVLKESGDLIKPINDKLFTESIIVSEIGELIGKKAQGRSNENDITIFKSVGLGVQDMFTANMIYEKYISQK